MIHRKFRSIYINIPVTPPERYLLTPAETAAAIGIAHHTLIRWRKTWPKKGTAIGTGPEPLRFGPHTWRYRRDEVCPPPEGHPVFLERMKQRLADDIASEKTPAKTFTATMKGIN
jgi:hypothetical protein